MKIWIAWAFSTGKTTLAKELSSYLPECKLDINIERELAELLEYDFNNHTPDEEDMYQRYMLQKTTMIATGNKDLITDTPLQTLLWYAENQQVRMLTQQAMSNLYDILLYLPPELDIENDWIRHINKKYQLEVDEQIRDAITLSVRRNPKLIARTIDWNMNDRIVDAMHYIEEFKKGKRWAWF